MDETPSSLAPPSVVPVTFAWLAVCLIVTTAASLGAAHAPPRMRLIGLFSIAFGLLIGWSVIRVAEMFDFLPSARLAGGVAALLAFCGLVGGMREAWRLDELHHGVAYKDRVAERLIEQLKQNSDASGSIPVETSSLAEFRWYLSRRVLQLGRWPSPWPELFWGLELIMGTTASYAAAFRLRKRREIP